MCFISTDLTKDTTTEDEQDEVGKLFGTDSDDNTPEKADDNTPEKTNGKTPKKSSSLCPYLPPAYCHRRPRRNMIENNISSPPVPPPRKQSPFHRYLCKKEKVYFCLPHAFFGR